MHMKKKYKEAQVSDCILHNGITISCDFNSYTNDFKIK